MKMIKFVRIVARNEFNRCGVRHPTHPRYYPKTTVNRDEIAALSARIKELGGELVVYFPGRDGEERTKFDRTEIAELRAEPMLVVDEVEVEFEPGAERPQTHDAPPHKRVG